MMWTCTFPRHTFASETIRDVSCTGGTFVNPYTCTHKCTFIYSFTTFHCFTSLAAPIGSISSMEVNVDLLDQMELIDISDHETLDVFFSSGGEDGVLTSPLPGIETRNRTNITRHTVYSYISNKCSDLITVQGNNNNNEEVISNGLFRHVLEGLEAKSRMSSTSSNSSSDSQIVNANGGDTPVVRSDDEETHTSTVKRRATPPEIEKVKSQTPSSSS